ncbi:MAG: ABC-three component system protein, partial [Cystobacter sp.]
MPKSLPPPVLLPSPPGPPPGLAADIVMSGQPIPAIDRIKLFSNEQWETFVLEWADSLRDEYERVERCGGAGDMGRDVIATIKNGSGSWDNYQCKHYKESLKPTDVWVELGKLVYYTKRGDYTYPRRYYFVAPQGSGTKLSNLLKKPNDLRAGLLANWDAHCRGGITSTQKVECDAALMAHIQGLDFSIFDAMPPLRIIDGHAKTRWHVARFGGGLPARPLPLAPPVVPGDTEAVFVRELYRAYGDHLKQDVKDVVDLAQCESLREHFADSRVEFYSAESLRTFSRD